MNYIVYEKTTGRIIRSGMCQPETFDHQAGAGQGILATDDHLDPNKWTVDPKTLTVCAITDSVR